MTDAFPSDRAAAESFMRAALDEAKKGLGRTSPNPAVGAVLVKKGRVIARGHHARAGGPHAESEVIRAAGLRAAGADLYTTLEPCDHFGRTPPCSRTILEAGIRRVFVGSRDPNPVVNGRGLSRLRRGGVEVVSGVLRSECERLNAAWFHYITTGLPYVTLKVAATLDGKVATRSGDSRWVTGPECRERVHRLRNIADAVLVGSGTAREDDPELTVRLRGRGWRDPLRVVLSARLELPRSLRLLHPRSSAPTLVAHVCPVAAGGCGFAKGVELLLCRARGGGVDLHDLLEKLAKRGVTHLLVEGGAQVFGSFLNQGLADRLLVFLAPKVVGGDGLSWSGGQGVERMADALEIEEIEIERLGRDLLIAGNPAGRLAKRRRRG